MLYIVATPIGNKEDITLRAREILGRVDVVIMESPLDSKKLLTLLGISQKKIIKYNDANAKRVIHSLREVLENNICAYITSAGTPGVSDPGGHLVAHAREWGVAVEVIPGVSSLTAAIAGSGMRINTFSFVGFLPRKEGHIKKIIEKYCGEDETLIFFESPFRIVKTMEIIHAIRPQSHVCAAKELTKMFERFIVGDPQKILSELTKEKNASRGEFVVIIQTPKSAQERKDE